MNATSTTPERRLNRTAGLVLVAVLSLSAGIAIASCSDDGPDETSSDFFGSVSPEDDESPSDSDEQDGDKDGKEDNSTDGGDASSDAGGSSGGNSTSGGDNGGNSNSGGGTPTSAPQGGTTTTAPQGGGNQAPAPVIDSFETPENIDCHNGMFQEFTARWTTTGAVEVTISIDGPGVYDTYPADGEASLPFNCSDSHTFLLTARGSDGQTATRTVVLDPRNVPSSDTEDDENL